MIRYLLDTDICVDLSRSKDVETFKDVLPHSILEVATSAITLFELTTGVLKSRYPQRDREALELMIADLTILDFTPRDAKEAAIIRADLENQGTKIGPYDILIAAIAKSNDLTLITNNTREFKRVKGLRVENWLER